jgi:hypothetical protein
MAHNFKILRHRTNGNLYLDLAGDFDGSSALELLNILKENLKHTARVSINTCNLKKIHPFGLQVFNQNFSKIKHRQTCIEFIGKNASQITSN